MARHSSVLLLAAVVALLVTMTMSASAQQVACARGEFEGVVDETAAALRDLNNKNRPKFQEKLRLLKDKRGWTDDQFLTEAAPFVKDEQIEVFDDKTNDLLAKITAMGQEGAAAKVPDCAMLGELRGHMTRLIATQVEKWGYMVSKLETALAK